MIWWKRWASILSLRIKWGWSDDVVDWVSCVCGWSEDDLMVLLIECRKFVDEVGWSDDVVDWVSCVCGWSDDDLIMLLIQCRVFMDEVRIIWWCYWFNVVCLWMKRGWSDDVVDWVSCVCGWSEDDLMKTLSEYLVFAYKMRMIWWCCWLNFVCLWMKRGWFDEDVERVSCLCV